MRLYSYRGLKILGVGKGGRGRKLELNPLTLSPIQFQKLRLVQYEKIIDICYQKILVNYTTIVVSTDINDIGEFIVRLEDIINLKILYSKSPQIKELINIIIFHDLPSMSFNLK